MRQFFIDWFNITREYIQPGADYQFEIGMIARIIQR